MWKQSEDAEQPGRFKEAALELGCDDSEKRFVQTVGKIAKAPPRHNATGKMRAKRSGA